MLNFRPHHVLTVLALLPALQTPVFAQLPECPTAKVPLHSSDPAYADAMELKHSLENNGFTIHCVFPAKFESFFRVDEGGVVRSTIEGDSNFRTNYGDVGVVFVPKPQTFLDFRIMEHRESGGYFYTFAGTPGVPADSELESPSRIYFLKHDNQLLMVDDVKLKGRLEQALHLPPPDHP